MTEKEQEERKPRIALVAGAIVGLLLVLGILYLLWWSDGAPSTPARTLTSLNLREGPGTNYPTMGTVPAGSEVIVVGRNEDGSWLVVATEGGDVWMTGHSDYVEIDADALAKLPIIEPPPPTYDSSNVQVNEVLNQIPLAVYHADRFTCASHAGLNNLVPSVAEGNVIGPHSGDFALVGKGGNVLFEYSDGTLLLLRDNPIARFDGGAKYLELATALEMFEQGDIVWTGSFGEWPARGIPGCDESAKPG